MFNKIKLLNYKCHEHLNFPLKSANILCGPNNAGKSTLIEAFRILHGSKGTLRSRKPTNQRLPDGSMVWGYEIPRASIPVNLAHVEHEFRGGAPVIEYTWKKNNQLRAHLSTEGNAIIEIVDGFNVRTTASFAQGYPLSFNLIPPLGPFEQQETYLRERTVQDGIGTRLASRHFRNYWMRQTEADFAAFKELFEKTWQGVELEFPTAHGYGDDRTVSMYFRDSRVPKEISWSGIGMQIWLQILTNLLRESDAKTIIIDEPDIYLHPDMQKQLLALLRERYDQYMIATHSPEIIGDAQTSEVVSVERGKKYVRRVTDISGLQSALIAVGSSENIELSKLSRAKRIVFFEGEDRVILKSFGRRLKLRNIEREGDTL